MTQRERIDDLEREIERIDELEKLVHETRQALGEARKYLSWLLPIVAMQFKWLNSAPFLSPKPSAVDQEVMEKWGGGPIDLDTTKLLYGDMHRHIAQYLEDRGIAPKDGEYKGGFRKQPFPKRGAAE